ncbi:putative reverse transcriptase [Operophtera brumata]|uniref:Putative reverse transcriptase n=1 Tax=Operophtera brumata TaxID=104452 RepID=A0A0L7LEY9_OPEBR|nr:putative reverse transcriptase [Operophtera brumata]
MVDTKYLKVGLFNAGSLNTGHDEFIVAMEELKPDIMAINETWMGIDEDEKAPRVPGYRLRFAPRPLHIRRGRGGGVGFYLKKGFFARNCPHPHAPSVEQMWIRVKVNGQDVIIGTAYKPPWQDPNQVLEALTDSVTSFAKYDHLILVGDLNMDILTPDFWKTKLLNQFLHSLNLNQVISEPTHFTDHSQTLIDIVCTDARVRNVIVKYSPDLGHHAMLLVELHIKKEKPCPRLVTYRPFRNILFDLFSNDLNSLNWEFFTVTTDVNELVATFTVFIMTLFDLHAPIKTTKFKEPPHPWITDTVKTMMRIRDDYHNRLRSLRTVALKNCYKEMKHLVIAAIGKFMRTRPDYGVGTYSYNNLTKEPITLS